jgi:hypothetical protein
MLCEKRGEAIERGRRERGRRLENFRWVQVCLFLFPLPFSRRSRRERSEKEEKARNVQKAASPSQGLEAAVLPSHTCSAALSGLLSANC